MLGKFLMIMSCVGASLQLTPFAPCKMGPVPLDLRVEDCHESPCLFVRGEDVKAEWDFTAVAHAEQLRPVVKVQATGLPVPITPPLPEPNACNSLSNGECPLEEEEVVTYNLQMPVLLGYPKASLHLSFSLIDDNDNIHVCFEIDAKVVDSRLLRDDEH